MLEKKGWIAMDVAQVKQWVEKAHIYEKEQLAIVVATNDLVNRFVDGINEDALVQSVMDMQMHPCEKLKCKYVLVLFEAQDEKRMVCFGSSKETRAIELVDYLIPQFGLSKGDAQIAYGRIAKTILNVKMQTLDLTDEMIYFQNRIEAYFEGCELIYPLEYKSVHEAELVALPQYVKKKIAWAFVPTGNIVRPGTKLRIKSLENANGNEVIAGDDSIIMIGVRGEVYDMKREKFERTYEATEEPLDVFEQMMDFIPEIETADTGEFITLDEIAKLCYPKRDIAIYAQQLTHMVKVFPTYANGDYFLGREGDYLAIRPDDLTDMYIIRKDIFEETYEPCDTI